MQTKENPTETYVRIVDRKKCKYQRPDRDSGANFQPFIPFIRQIIPHIPTNTFICNIKLTSTPQFC